MTERPADPVQVLSTVLMDATETHPALHDELRQHVNQVSDTVINTILAKTQQGDDLRAALGVEITKTTRTGKNLRAAMDAYNTPETSGGQSA